MRESGGQRLVITEEQAAAALGLSPRTLQRWRCEGRGPAWCKIGKRALYEPDELRRFVASSRRQVDGNQAA